MCEPTAVGRQPHTHIERCRDWRLAHESGEFYPKQDARRFQLGHHRHGAVAAVMLSMGTVHADIPVGDEGYSILYGGDGTDPGVTAAQAANNLTLDTELFDKNPGGHARRRVLPGSRGRPGLPRHQPGLLPADPDWPGRPAHPGCRHPVGFAAVLIPFDPPR